jgi:uroporphyrinogen-III decarboxylase
MAPKLSSRDRMLAAIGCDVPDYVPCSFMLFAALRKRCADEFEFVRKQLDLGLDAFVRMPVRLTQASRAESEHQDLYGLPVRFDPRVEVKNWREEPAGSRYPVIHREYVTPAGVLRTAVNQTDDWPHGARVPLFDDYIVPRAQKHLITDPEDLPALRYLLTPPTDEDIAAFREQAQVTKAFAAKHNLLVVGEWGVLFDAACWLCGIQDLMLMAAMTPPFVRDLLTIIYEWNRRRMDVVLEAGVDLLVRRAWYETVDFLSPPTYRQLILPLLTEDAQQAHQAGTRLALITTAAYTPLLDMYLESGIDVLIGLDPVQDARADFALTKRKLAGRVCLWGGVNGFVTVETGTPAQVRGAVRAAIRQLGPGGGFILSPIDNVTADSPDVWANVSALVDEWRACREYPIQT